MIRLSIKAKNCKCFGGENEGIDNILPINIIIGKNNSGKSALLDLVQYVINPNSINLVGHKNNLPSVILTKPLTEVEILGSFTKDLRGGGVPGNSFFDYGKEWIGKNITVEVLKDRKRFINTDPTIGLPENVIIQHNFRELLIKNFANPIGNKKFRKLTAERNILPEVDNDNPFLDDGSGATNLIQHFYNKENLNSRELVEVKLLDALNLIFSPEAKFERILLQQLSDGKWEIYLTEKNKGNIPLSNSGSGLKTVILVLINLLLLPEQLGGELSDYIFAFEELENNLHPALQRKLLLYIRNTAKDHNTTFFITTHSNVIIDLFSNDGAAQIIHVKNNGQQSTALKIETHLDKSGVLEDLDFRASDLLQSNSIVWLEGPSDRVYFNKWIKLFTNNELREGVHYQCLFYGGRLLAHLTANSEEEEEAISILKINRNAILLMDSDKKNKNSRINSTKERIKKEIESIGGIPWITKGREIENYLTTNTLKRYYGNNNLRELGDFEKFSAYLDDQIKLKEGDKFNSNKVLFSERIIDKMQKDDFCKLDLEQQLRKIVKKIFEWNKIEN